jgi:hypothetical protein
LFWKKSIEQRARFVRQLADSGRRA